MEKARKCIADNIKECCQEIIEWRQTGILKSDGKLRDAARLITLNQCDKLRMAEDLVYQEAMEIIVKEEL